MAYPATQPAAITTGTTISKSTFGDLVLDALNFLANRPACRVHNSASQTISNNTLTAITFNSERYDTATMHSTVTNTSRITIPVAGIYNIVGSVEWPANGTGTRQALIRVNGSTTIAGSTAPGNAAASSPNTVGTQYKFAVNDYVELMVFQNSGGNLDAQLNANQSPEFSATWIGNG